MQITVILRLVGLFLTLFSFTMLTPIVVSYIYNDQSYEPFLLAFSITLGSGTLIWLPFRRFKKELRVRDGFIVVVIFWVVLGLFGALPLMFGVKPKISFTDAVFESVSGLTTTGASVIQDLEILPKSVLYYRQQLHWLGGMGVVVLAVAILPMLGIGGMQLYRAETPGPVKDSKLTPRITETAKALWYVYLGVTAACAMAYWLAGMTVFDALTHSFSTVSTGGFANYNASMGHYTNPSIALISTVFMFVGAINFSLHFIAWRTLNIKTYWQDSEFKAYVLILVVVGTAAALYLYYSGTFKTLGPAVIYGFFQTVSMGTSTGFTVINYDQWPVFVLALLLMLGFLGGCAGSTAGGLKIIRVLLLYRQGIVEIVRLIHPNAVMQVKIGTKSLPEGIVTAVWGFFFLYMVTFSLMALVLSMTGLDLITAFSAVAACINNTGPGLGTVIYNYAHFSSFGKWVLCFTMLAGRLEIFTLLVIVSPAFWRR